MLFHSKNQKKIRIIFTVLGVLLILSMVLTYSGLYYLT